MSAERDGGAAFPRPLPTAPVPLDEAIAVIEACRGMSLRDYFAAKALPAVIDRTSYAESHPEMIAETCYVMADAMLKARSA